MSFFLEHIESMQAYIPGESADGPGRIVKLNQNENPYPPSPRVRQVMDDFDVDSLRVYPDALANVFRNAAAEVHDIDPATICVGDGSDDLIIILARAVADASHGIAFSEPNFPYYRTQAAVQNAPVLSVPADTDSFAQPLDKLAEINASLSFVANPNSPTGAVADLDQLKWLAEKLDGILVIDEAYADFAGFSAIPLAARYDNVMVMRTLSKSHSLAGLRLGYAVAGEKIMSGIMKTRAIYNVGALSAAMAAAAISDTDYHDKCVKLIITQRDRLTAELTNRKWRVWPSGGNFVMASPPATPKTPATPTTPDAQAIDYFNALKARKVLVRYFNRPPMSDKIRISIGTEQDIDALLAALDDFTARA